jgi:hypothetical protein
VAFGPLGALKVKLQPQLELALAAVPQVLQFSYVYALPAGRGTHFGVAVLLEICARHPIERNIGGGVVA